MWVARVTIYVIGLVLGLGAGRFLGATFADSDKIQDFFVSVYSTLVGFLIAVLAILIDPKPLSGSWRVAYLQKDELTRRSIRHLLIFYAYLGTLLLVLILKFTSDCKVPGRAWIGSVAAFLAVSSFVWSFELPLSLFGLQRDKLDAIEHERS